jgi:hypothetical protein
VAHAFFHARDSDGREGESCRKLVCHCFKRSLPVVLFGNTLGKIVRVSFLYAEVFFLVGVHVFCFVFVSISSFLSVGVVFTDVF